VVAITGEGTAVAIRPYLCTIRPINFPELYLRHRNFEVWIDPGPAQYSEPFDHDSTWAIVAGLASPELVSFRASNVEYQNYYLRHRNFEFFLDPLPPQGDPGLEQFVNDATFIWEPTMSFRAVNANLQNFFMRHNFWRVKLHQRPAGPENSQFEADSTWTLGLSRLIIID
jgi:hypothetical protein